MNDQSEAFALQSKLNVEIPETDEADNDHHLDEAALRRGSIWFFVVIALVAVGWIASVVLFGLPGLIMPALAMVPVVFILLLMISWG